MSVLTGTGLPCAFIPIEVTQAMVVGLHGTLSVLLFATMGAAMLRRRTAPYVLLWVATATLLVDSIFGVMGFVALFDPANHVLIDHGLDSILVVTVMAAIYLARRVESSAATPTNAA